MPRWTKGSRKWTCSTEEYNQIYQLGYNAGIKTRSGRRVRAGLEDALRAVARERDQYKAMLELIGETLAPFIPSD